MKEPKEDSLISIAEKETIRKLDAFENIDKNNMQKIIENGKILNFKEGWPLSNIDEINSNIYFILNGTARLLESNNNKLLSIEKLNAGDSIGLSSLIRGEPCEQVSASTKLKVFAITFLAVSVSSFSHLDHT